MEDGYSDGEKGREIDVKMISMGYGETSKGNKSKFNIKNRHFVTFKNKPVFTSNLGYFLSNLFNPETCA